MGSGLDRFVDAYGDDNEYGFDNTIMLRWYARRIIELAGDAGSALELGIGHGITTDILATHFARHLVVDGSREMIERFRARYPECGAEVVEAYFESFTTEERFDIIVMGFVLEHVDDPVVILRQYQEFLKPGGSIFVTVPNAEALNRRLGHLAGMLPDIMTLSENDLRLGHQRYYTVRSLREVVSRAAYELIAMEGVYLKPFTTRQMVSLGLGPEVLEALCQVGIGYPELSCGILAQLRLASSC